MAKPATENYAARRGYREIDARRYERRRYGSLSRRVNRWWLERTLGRALAGVARGGLVLDVPCGTGILTSFFAARGLRVVGADISPAMLAVAHGVEPAVGHVRADLEQPPHRAGSFDAVVCNRFLMHLPASARPRVLATLATLTRGPLVVTVCHPYTFKRLGRLARGWFGGHAKLSQRLTRRALAAEVRAAGLQLERLIPLMPILSEVWVVVLRDPAHRP